MGSFHARCERCGKYEPAEAADHPAWPSLPKGWRCIGMPSEQPNLMSNEIATLCGSCAGDVWAFVMREMKFKTENH